MQRDHVRRRSRWYGAAFSPLSLFFGGANGAWYDPSDFSTMFQDAAGTVPVTAVGQPVGLMLDKSKGLVLGPELVTNGDFSNGTTGWTVVSGGTQSNVSGELQVTRSGAPGASSSQPITTVIGRSYKVTGVQRVVSGSCQPNLVARVGSSPIDTVVAAGISTTDTTPALNTLIFTASGTTTYIHLQVGSAAGTAGFDNISVRELPGNHAFNPSGNSANFPVLQQDGTGRYYLSFNGVNQWLQTNSIDFTYGDKMFVCAGVRKLSDVARGMALEMSAGALAGSFNINAPTGALTGYLFQSVGSSGLVGSAITSGYSSPITNVLTGIGDISAPSAILRVNGSQVAQSTSSQGTGNYGNYPLYIGARAGTSLFFNGRLYGLVVAGKQASASEIASTESWLNQKTGAY